MSSTYFDTFITAFSVLEEDLRLRNGDFVTSPPIVDFGYQSTPINALTFAHMGVDGVHFAVLKIGGEVRDDSPIIEVSPMDSKDVIVLAGSFLGYLADGCDVSVEEMLSILDAERAGKKKLVKFLQEKFDHIRLLEESRSELLEAKFGHLIERRIRN